MALTNIRLCIGSMSMLLMFWMEFGTAYSPSVYISKVSITKQCLASANSGKTHRRPNRSSSSWSQQRYERWKMAHCHIKDPARNAVIQQSQLASVISHMTNSDSDNKDFKP